MRTSENLTVRTGGAGQAALDAAGVRAEIVDIELRAAALNITLSRLCGLAKVPVYNVFRWRNGIASPGLCKYRAAMTALEGALADERARLRKLLEAAA